MNLPGGLHNQLGAVEIILAAFRIGLRIVGLEVNKVFSEDAKDWTLLSFEQSRNVREMNIVLSLDFVGTLNDVPVSMKINVQIDEYGSAKPHGHVKLTEAVFDGLHVRGTKMTIVSSLFGNLQDGYEERKLPREDLTPPPGKEFVDDKIWVVMNRLMDEMEKIEQDFIAGKRDSLGLTESDWPVLSWDQYSTPTDKIDHLDQAKKWHTTSDWTVVSETGYGQMWTKSMWFGNTGYSLDITWASYTDGEFIFEMKPAGFPKIIQDIVTKENLNYRYNALSEREEKQPTPKPECFGAFS